MHYYEELLESFIKLKKRKFKLTVMEQGGDVAAQSTDSARNALVQFFQTLTPGAQVAMPSLQPGEYSNSVMAYLDDGVPMVKSSHLAPNTANPINALQKMNVNGKRLVAWYLGEGGKKTGDTVDPTITAPTTPPKPGDALLAGIAEQEEKQQESMGSEADKKKVADIFPSINKNAEALWPKVLGSPQAEKELSRSRDPATGEETEDRNIKGPRGFAGRFVGGRNYSVESQFAHAQKVIRDDEGNMAFVGLSLGEMHIASLQINKLLDYAGRESISENDGADLRSAISFQDDNTVFIRTGDGPDEGLVFADTGGVIKAAMRTAEDVGAFKYDVLPVADSIAGISSWRGKHLELVGEIRSWAKLCVRDREMGVEVEGSTPIACQVLARKSQDFMANVEKFIAAHQWAKSFLSGEAAINAEDQTIVDSIMNIDGLNGEGLEDMVVGLFSMSKESDDKLGASMFIPTGAETGGGKKKDVVPVWLTEEEARQGLINKGFSEDHITEHGMVKPTTVAEIFGENTQLMGEYMQVEGLQPDSVIYWHGQSLKHYESGLHNPKLGDLTSQKTDQILMGEETERGWPDMLTQSWEALGVGPSQQASVREQCTEFRDLENTVRGLNVNAIVRDENGKRVTTGLNAVQNFAKQLKEQVHSSRTVDELFDNNNIHGATYTALNRLLESQGGVDALSTQEGEERFKELASRYLRHRLVTQRINDPSNDNYRGARDYLATTMYMTGASVDDGDSADMRDLKTFALKYFRHNHLFDVLKAWRNKTSFTNPQTGEEMTVGLSRDTNSIHTKLILNEDEKLGLYLSMSGETSRSGGVVNRASRGSSHGTTGLVDLVSTSESRMATPGAVNTDSHDPINDVIEEYLVNQRTILYKILETK